MADSWSWNVAELPYRYGVEIRGDKVAWIWDSGHGIPPTEELQPASALLSQGRAAVPTAWQQIPPPILDQLSQRLQALSGASAATGPTQFAPAVTAAVASNPQGSAAAGSSAPAGWGPAQAAAPAAPGGWGQPGASVPGAQQGFGPAQGPPPPSAPASHQPATQPSNPAAGAGALAGAAQSASGGPPTSGALPTAAPDMGGDPKAQVLGLLRAGEKAKAIDLYRHHFKVSAMLAKEEVEYLAQTLRDE